MRALLGQRLQQEVFELGMGHTGHIGSYAHRATAKFVRNS
jgi:hypothetical protein